MKKIFTCLAILFAINQGNAQDITGSWLGSVPIGGGSLKLVFNISKTSDTAYSSTFDSPDQKAFGIACNRIYKKKDSLFIGIQIIKGGYNGIWDGKDNISGTFKQGSHEVTLNLKRISENEKKEIANGPSRPQTPKPPFGYHTEDVEYDNADKSLHYGATFTRPNGSEKYPAVIIITGSGTQDRDGTIFGHKLYWVLADYLTKNGIAVLRVDDRGAGKSTKGNIEKATSLDFSYDVETSLNYLETRGDVDVKHLGLIGHSEGGIIAPMVATRRNDVSFIVMWGAPETGGAEINTEQNIYSLQKAGLDSLSISSFASLHKKILNLFAGAETQQILDKKIADVFSAWKKDQSPGTLSALGIKDNTLMGQDLFTVYDGLYNMPWMRFFIIYKPGKDLEKVHCPVLAVNGAKDTQVDAKSNLAEIKAILKKNGNKDFETVEIPNVNHLLQTAVTGDVSEYEKTAETMSPTALNIICTWIKLHIQ